MNILLNIAQLLIYLTAMGGNPVVTDSTANYVRYRMADNCYYEAYTYPASHVKGGKDSVLIVETVCAPICASHARVYIKEYIYDAAGWPMNYLDPEISVREIPAPWPNAVFPYATIINGELKWEDHTDEMLDDEERPQGEE